ncbi:MAG: type II toxin-antitoxin system RelE/ParE family toxin [Gammaproteobacteria bacterium]|nr:type II toxin-antitoxin system RelE/ParE family toxin [Gammaproteobacteria bacterium]
MKTVIWQSDSLKTLKSFPSQVKYAVGVELMRVQSGLTPMDSKPMQSIGPGVREIRVQYRNQYRVLYIASFDEAVYVLGAFIKKTQRTPKTEIDLAKQRLREVKRSRK